MDDITNLMKSLKSSFIIRLFIFFIIKQKCECYEIKSEAIFELGGHNNTKAYPIPRSGNIKERSNPFFFPRNRKER